MKSLHKKITKDKMKWYSWDYRPKKEDNADYDEYGGLSVAQNIGNARKDVIRSIKRDTDSNPRLDRIKIVYKGKVYKDKDNIYRFKRDLNKGKR